MCNKEGGDEDGRDHRRRLTPDLVKGTSGHQAQLAQNPERRSARLGGAASDVTRTLPHVQWGIPFI